MGFLLTGSFTATIPGPHCIPEDPEPSQVTFSGDSLTKEPLKDAVLTNLPNSRPQHSLFFNFLWDYQQYSDISPSDSILQLSLFGVEKICKYTNKQINMKTKTKAISITFFPKGRGKAILLSRFDSNPAALSTRNGFYGW